MKQDWFMSLSLGASEEELHVLRSQFLQCGRLIFIQGTPDKIGFLLLKLNDSRLDRVLNTEPGDHTGPLLANSVTAVGALPFRRGIPPWVDNENSGCFRQVECHATSLEGDQENFNLGLSHEMFNGLLPLGWGHRSIQHHGVEPGMA